MNTLICAGGTGARVLEATLHLCAAGLGPKTLRLLVIDPDRSNGNGDRATALVDRYVEGHRRFSRLADPTLRLFGTELDVLDVGRERGLKVWSPVRTSDRLQDLLKINLIGESGMPADLWKLLFTRQELEMDLREGFRARPSVGAAAMSLVALHADEQPWSLLLDKIKNDLAHEAGARVFLAGSVFGGTGAATLFPIARFLRDRFPGPRLKIAAAPFTPYFRFEAAAAAETQPKVPEAARSEDFPTHTRGAVDFYRQLEQGDTKLFDVLFWVGDSSPKDVPYAPGGSRQRNPAHLVELIGALALLEFLAAPNALQGSCYAAAQPSDEAQPEGTAIPVGWSDLPLVKLTHGELRNRLLRFWLVGLVHLGFAGALVRRPEIDQDPRLVPWYWRRFAKFGASLSSESNREGLDFLDAFFTEDHFPWWQQVHDAESIHLADPTALPSGDSLQLAKLAAVLWSSRARESDPDAMDRFYSDLSSVPQRLGGAGNAAAYLELLAHAADRFINREYRRNATEEGD
jgi:hypothetical protein